MGATLGVPLPSSSIAFGPFRVDLSREQLLRDGEPVHLRPKSWQVLRHLAERPGAVVTQQELLDAVWPDTAVVPQVLTNVVGELRGILGDAHLKTLRGRGFRLAIETSAAGAATLTDRIDGFVGRREELAALRALWDAVQQGSRRTALIAGPAGIGKTSLVDVFLRSLATDRQARVAHGACIAGHGQAEPFFPVLSALGALLRTSEPESIVELMRRYAPYWLSLIPGAAPPEDAAQSGGGPPATPAQVLRGAAALLEELGRAAPLVLVLEDLQWVDASTLDLLSLLAERPEPAQLLLVATYRSADALAYRAPVIDVARRLRHRGHALELALAPLSATALREYLELRFGSEVGEQTAEVATEHTGGNPLFLRLAVDHYVERGWIERTADGWRLEAGARIREGDLPEDLRDLIADQYRALSPPEAEILRVASVCGEAFESPLVGQVLGVDEHQVARTCRQLANRAQLIAVAEGEKRFRFLHAVHRQVVQELLLGEARGLHRKLAEVLVTGAGALDESGPGPIAYHFQAAGESARAAKYFERAAFVAASQGAYREAVASLRTALQELATLASDPATRERERRIQLTLSFLLLVVEGYASAEALAALERVEALSDTTEGDPILFEALAAIAVVRWNAGQVEGALADAQRAAELARDCHPPGIARADAIWGYAHTTAGQLSEARSRLESALAGEKSLAGPLFNMESTSGTVLALVLSMQGELDEAQRLRERVTSLAESTGTPLERMFAVFFGAAGAVAERDSGTTLAFAERGEALDDAYGIVSLGDGVRLLAEWARRNEEDPPGDTATLRRLQTERQERGEHWASDAVYALLAELELRRGDLAAAQADVEAGLREVRERGQRLGRVDLLRLEAQLHGERGEGERAEAAFEAALEAARAQGAGLYLARAETAYGRWLAAEGRRGEALERLRIAMAALGGAAGVDGDEARKLGVDLQD